MRSPRVLLHGRQVGRRRKPLSMAHHARQQRTSLLFRFVSQPDHVVERLALLADTPHLFAARKRALPGAQLHCRRDAAVAFRFHQLVDAAERGRVADGADRRPDAERSRPAPRRRRAAAIRCSSRSPETMICVARKPPASRIARTARGRPREVPAVDAHRRRREPAVDESLRRGDRCRRCRSAAPPARRTAPMYPRNASISSSNAITHECAIVPDDGQAEPPAGLDVRRRGCTRPGTRRARRAGGFQAVRAARSEFDHGRPAAAFTTREALLATDVWNVIIASSAVSTSCASAARAVTRRIGSCAKTISPSSTAQTSPLNRKFGSTTSKNDAGTRRECRHGAQPGDLVRGESHAFEKVEGLVQPGGDEIGALGRQLADEQLERAGRRPARPPRSRPSSSAGRGRWPARSAGPWRSVTRYTDAGRPRARRCSSSTCRTTSVRAARFRCRTATGSCPCSIVWPRTRARWGFPSTRRATGIRQQPSLRHQRRRVARALRAGHAGRAAARRSGPPAGRADRQQGHRPGRRRLLRVRG